MKEMKPCPLCENNCEVYSIDPLNQLFTIVCPFCGKYNLTDIAKSVLGKRKDNFHIISGITRNYYELHKDTEGFFVIKGEMIDDDAKFQAKFISKAPKSIPEKALLLLQYICRKSNYQGDKVLVNFPQDYPICFCKNEKELIFYIRHIRDSGDIKADITMRDATLSLTMKGWQEVESFNRSNIESKQALEHVGNDLRKNPPETEPGNKDTKSEREGGFIGNTKPTIKNLLSKNFVKATIKHFPYCGSYLFDVIYGVDAMKEQKGETRDRGNTYNINAKHVSLGDKAQHASGNINTITPEPEKERGGWGLITKISLILGIIVSLIVIVGTYNNYIRKDKPAVEQSEISKTEAKTIKEVETEKQIQPEIIQQTMNDSPGGTQVAGDLYISETENTRDKPIVVANATVEVKIKSDLDVNGIAANVKAYLVFVKDEKPLLITSSIGYTENQTGNDEVVYKAKLNMDANDSATENSVSFLKDADYILIKFSMMPPDSYVLEGEAICIINNSVRLGFSIPPQKLVNNRILIRSLSESLRVLNEP